MFQQGISLKPQSSSHEESVNIGSHRRRAPIRREIRGDTRAMAILPGSAEDVSN